MTITNQTGNMKRGAIDKDHAVTRTEIQKHIGCKVNGGLDYSLRQLRNKQQIGCFYKRVWRVVEDIKKNPNEYLDIFQMERKDIENENDIWFMAEGELIDWDFEYECMVENLTDIMQDVSKRYVAGDIWKVSGESMGWKGLEGYKIARAENGRELLEEILPETDCTFFIYIEKGKRGLKIYNYHHDTRFNSRGYELYYIHPLTKKEREEYFNGEY